MEAPPKKNSQTPSFTDLIKNYRLDADKLVNSMIYLNKSREVSLAHTNLQRCKMWLGKTLGEFGNPTPYPHSEDAKSKVIEPQAEHTENDFGEYLESHIDYTQTARVKYMRSICEDLTLLIKNCLKYNWMGMNKFAIIYLQQSLIALEEAKMWLGMELDRIRTLLAITIQDIETEKTRVDIPLI